MNKLFISIAIMTIATTAFAQSEQEIVSSEPQKNSWGAKLKESNFHLCLQLQTKYIFRGMEMMTEDAAPVVFPGIYYSNKGFNAYILGGYALNGKYSLVDFGLSYSFWWLTIGLNDYYYPTTTSPIDRFFNYKTGQTGHWLEAVITFAPAKAPVYLTVSNFFYGADRYPVVDDKGNKKEKQAYSTYAEIGTYYDFLNNNRISLAVGAALNKSCYNGYDKNFSVCNVELKYTYNAAIKNFIIPLSVAGIYNPVCNKMHVNFVASLAF